MPLTVAVSGVFFFFFFAAAARAVGDPSAAMAFGAGAESTIAATTRIAAGLARPRSLRRKVMSDDDGRPVARAHRWNHGSRSFEVNPACSRDGLAGAVLADAALREPGAPGGALEAAELAAALLDGPDARRGAVGLLMAG